MSFFSSGRRWIAVALFMLLVLFLLRPGASRLKSRIISSISFGVGRPVDIGSVHVRLLPRPGFDIENLVIYDDPMFGAEPMLRAGEVTADLRIVSLLKGRIEVSRMNLTEPSFNLVRRTGGDWNLQTLLERTAHNVTAPTGPRKPAPRPQFPYIEGSSGRINFKTGAEKRPYALINADFSLWQESEDSWGIRLKAQPFSTDLNLTDLGQLQVSGTWKRSESFQDTPIELSAEWSKAQLGQLTKLLTGKDKGWRGNIQLDAMLTGTPAKLRIASTATMDDFRRYDITSGNALLLAARCDGEYISVTHEFHEITCTAPVREGSLTLTGRVGLPGSQRYSIAVKADDVPAIAVVALAERAKKNIPDDLVAAGTLKGTALIEHGAPDSSSRFRGSGEIAGFRLSSANTKIDLGPTTVPFQLVDDSIRMRDRSPKGHVVGLAFPRGAHVEFGPVILSATRNSASLRGWLNRSSYSFSVYGETGIAQALRMARVAGIPAPVVNPEGSAQLNLQIAGSWVGFGDELGVGFPAPEVTGTARLRNVHVMVPGGDELMEIASADMQLTPEKVQVGKLKVNGAGAVWSGSLEMPRGCGTPEACAVHFTLNTPELVFSRVGEWVNGRQKSLPWYRILEPAKRLGQSFLGKVRASGELTANRFLLHSIEASNVSAKVRLDSGKLEFSSLDADLLNGKHRGRWSVEFNGTSAICGGSGIVTGIALGQTADAAHDRWVNGTASGSYEVKGSCSAEFWQSAAGKFQAELSNGMLPRLLIGDDPEPLAFTNFIGQARLDSGRFELSSAKLISTDGTYDLSGTVTLQHEIDVKMTRVPTNTTHAGYAVTGTLAQPRVSLLGNTEQAKLKTPPAK